MQAHSTKFWVRSFLQSWVSALFFSGVGPSPFGTAATSGLLYKPQMIDEGDCGAIGGMKIGRENRSTRRKPAPALLCPPQIPHDQTRNRTPGRRGGKPATNCLSYGAASGLFITHKFTSDGKWVSVRYWVSAHSRSRGTVNGSLLARYLGYCSQREN
jgi:hypothetical protein